MTFSPKYASLAIAMVEMYVSTLPQQKTVLIQDHPFRLMNSYLLAHLYKPKQIIYQQIPYLKKYIIYFLEQTAFNELIFSHLIAFFLAATFKATTTLKCPKN